LIRVASSPANATPQPERASALTAGALWLEELHREENHVSRADRECQRGCKDE